jgi:hypothetical protein
VRVVSLVVCVVLPFVAVVGGEEAGLEGVEVLLERAGLDVLAHPVGHELPPPLPRAHHQPNQIKSKSFANDVKKITQFL